MSDSATTAHPTTAPQASPTVNRIMVEQRASSFQTRSIKTTSKAAGLRLAIAMTDLTTLEGKDSPEKVRSLCAKAIRPFPQDEQLLGDRLPSVAAVCVYPSMVPFAKEKLDGSGVKVASVATGFPSGQFPLSLRLRDVEQAVKDGADEIDMVINRGAFLSGDYDTVAEEIALVTEACGPAHLKVILETGELETYDNVRRASDIAIEHIRDGDFIKTSTGKVSPAATMPITLVMLEAIRDEALRGGKTIGMKPAGGIRAAKQALHYLVMVKETLSGAKTNAQPGEAKCPWLDPDLFRFGASSLLNDLLRQIVKLGTGRYQAGYDFSDA